MPDTHDERGGDDAATPFETAERILAKCRKRRLATVADVEILGRLVVELVLSEAADEAEEKLLAATARAEKAEAYLAKLGYACCVCGGSRNLGYRNYRDQLFCWPCADGEPVAADAAQGGLSAMQAGADGAQASPEGSNSSASPGGPQEPEPERDPSAWCWAPNPAGRLHCGRLRDHEPPHRRGERTWPGDDTTEGR